MPAAPKPDLSASAASIPAATTLLPGAAVLSPSCETLCSPGLFLADFVTRDDLMTTCCSSQQSTDNQAALGAGHRLCVASCQPTRCRVFVSCFPALAAGVWNIIASALLATMH